LPFSVEPSVFCPAAELPSGFFSPCFAAPSVLFALVPGWEPVAFLRFASLAALREGDGSPALAESLAARSAGLVPSGFFAGWPSRLPAFGVAAWFDPPSREPGWAGRPLLSG